MHDKTSQAFTVGGSKSLQPCHPESELLFSDREKASKLALPVQVLGLETTLGGGFLCPTVHLSPLSTCAWATDHPTERGVLEFAVFTWWVLYCLRAGERWQGRAGAYGRRSWVSQGQSLPCFPEPRAGAQGLRPLCVT